MRSTALVLAILLGVHDATHADPDDDDGPRSPAAATWLSVGFTAAGYTAAGIALATDSRGSGAGRIAFALGGSTALVGPSIGHLYAGQWDMTGGMVLRIAALPTVVIGGFVIAAECAELDPCPDHTKGNVVLGLAGALVIAGTAWDIATAGAQARRYNRNWRSPPVTLIPTAAPGQAGLALHGRF